MVRSFPVCLTLEKVDSGKAISSMTVKGKTGTGDLMFS